MQRQNQYLNCLIDPSFQEANKPFVLSFENNVVRTYDDIQKITTGQGNDCTTGDLLDCPCF